MSSNKSTDNTSSSVIDLCSFPSFDEEVMEWADTSDRQLIQDNIVQLRKQLGEQLAVYSQARVKGDMEGAETALKSMEGLRRHMTTMQEYTKYFQAEPVKEKSVRCSGLTLSHRDLPKFQLASSVVRPFPGCEVFESVEHFLKTFENIVQGSSYKNVEEVWRQFFPLCLPFSESAWVETDLKKCSSWSEAREAFVDRHGSRMAASYYNDLVFTMTMMPRESIGDYSKRFLQTVYNAGLYKDCPRVADRFLSSMTVQVQAMVRLAVARFGRSRKEKELNWTVEYIAQVGRDVLGDNPKSYEEATAILPTSGRREKPITAPGSPYPKQYKSRPFHAALRSRYEKRIPDERFYCSHHGKNRTHHTKDCFSVVKRGNEERKERSCYKCRKPWQRGHVCQAAGERRVLAVKRVQANDPAAEAEAADRAITSAMEGISYDCKSENENIQKMSNRIRANAAFNLLTPIIIEGVHLVGMVDTGSNTSFVNKSLTLSKLKHIKIKKLKGYYNFLSYDNGTSRFGITDPLQFKYANGITFTHCLEVIVFNDDFKFDVLLGTDILPKMNIGLTGVAYSLGSEHTHSDAAVKDDMIFENINIDQANNLEPDNSPAGTTEQRAEFYKIIEQSLNRNREIPVTSHCPMPESIIHLPTKEGATAYRRQYPIPHALKPVLNKQIDEWLQTGTIVKSKVNTSFNSPLLLVPKRNKAGELVSHRVCLDVRLLNKILPPTFNYPVPLVREIFDNLAGRKVFSTIDLSNAYHRFKVAPEDVHKLTFTHDNAQYSFVKGCFGVKMLTSQFQKCLAILFDGIDCVQNFVDDCIVASDSYEQHAHDVKLVIDRLTSVNLIINPDKCVWFQQSVRLLGFVVNTTGTKVDRNKLTNVENWPLPNKNNKQIQQFMGLINYFREYIPMISRVAEPITKLSNAANVAELWTDEQTRSFIALKKILQSDMILHYPDLNRPFFVATDASVYGVAAVLYQKDQHERHQYVSFVSSSLSPSQRRWSTTKRELYAIVLALKKFRKFLWGRHFVVYTDHKALVYLHTQKIANPMMIGWIETLLDFDFEVVHIPGILNKLPDVLSRLYPPLEDENKLVGDSGSSKSKVDKTIKRVVMKRKRYSKDKIVNVLASRLVGSKDEVTDYMTPPEEERDTILRETHAFGHFGYQAIVREIHSRGMHWTNIYDEAKTIVKSCIECQKHSIMKRGYHPLTSVVANRPFDHVAIDLAGPLPITEQGCLYLLVLTDICTKYVVIRALPNKQSDTVAKALVSIFGDYGWPFIIQSDNGTEFRNSLLNSITANMGVDRRFSTAFHPQGNGSAEASVKIVLNTVRKMMQSNSRDWDHYVPIVQLSINKYIKNKTLSSPFSLMYARRVNLPDDYADNKKYPIPKDLMTVKELEDRIVYMENVIFPAIEERTKKINEEYEKRYNDKNMLIDIPIGSHVMVRLKSRANKLAPLYEGPYTVVRKNRGGSYELKDEQNELLHRNYTPSELKIINIDESRIEDEYFEVEGIRDHRGPSGRREYLVKWAGYGERANTWQEASDFTDPTIIQKYWDKHEELKKLEHERAEEIIAESAHKKRRISKIEEKKATSVQSNKRAATSTDKSKRRALSRK